MKDDCEPKLTLVSTTPHIQNTLRLLINLNPSNALITNSYLNESLMAFHGIIIVSILRKSIKMLTNFMTSPTDDDVIRQIFPHIPNEIFIRSGSEIDDSIKV